MVIAKNCAWLLFLLHAQCLTGLILIVILGEIARLEIEIRDLCEDAILGGELLFETASHIELLEVVVGALSVFGSIRFVDGVAGIAEDAVLRRRLNPVPGTAVLGVRVNSQVIPVEKSRVFLLGDVL